VAATGLLIRIDWTAPAECLLADNLPGGGAAVLMALAWTSRQRLGRPDTRACDDALLTAPAAAAAARCYGRCTPRPDHQP
jgi:hypothetical protein